MFLDIRSAITHLDQRIIELGRQMDRRLESVEMKFLALEQRGDRGYETLDAKISRQFTWLVGMHVTTLAGVVTTLAAVVAAFVSR